MIKLIKLSIAFFFISLFSYSQIQVSGRVIDSESNAMDFVNVILMNNNKIVAGTITNENGNFKVIAKKGNYKLHISFIGSNDYIKDLNLDKEIDLGNIILENANDLEEVVITSKKKLIERKVDRLIFNVENSIAASGKDALETLKVTPRVRVQGGDISMVGKSGMSVLINDRLVQLSGDDLANFLRTIQSDNIKKIEVITNPPAKYESEGNSGLINIVLKKAKSDSWHVSTRTSYKQAVYATGALGVGFAYQKDKLTLFSDVNYSNGSVSPIGTSKIFYPEQLWNEETNLRQYENPLAYKLGVTYELSKKVNVGIQYTGNMDNSLDKDFNKVTLTNNVTQALDSLILTNARTTGKKIYNSINAHLIYKLDTVSGKVLSLDYDFFNYKRDNDRLISSNNYFNRQSIIPNSYFSAQNSGNQNITNNSINVDVEHPLKSVSLNYGGKLSFTKTTNEVVFNNLTSGVAVLDLSQSNEFEYKENRQALYLSLQKVINDKWEVKIGGRVENTETKGYSKTLNQLNKKSYFEFFPTAYLSYVPNDNNTFSINYGKRISRPTFSFLNPFRWYTSNYSFIEGNPQLNPSFTHNIEFEFTHNGNWINSLYFSRLTDGFEYVTIVDPLTNKKRLSATNFIKSDNIGLYEMLSLQPYEWLTTNLAMNVYYSNSKSDISVTAQSKSGWGAEGYIGTDFVLRKDKKLLFNLTYIIASDGADNLDQSKSFSQLDTSLKMFLLKKKLQVTLSGSDILKTNIPEYIGTSNNVKTSFKNYNDTRYFKLSLTYNFGKEIDVNERSIKNIEEKDRIK